MDRRSAACYYPQPEKDFVFGQFSGNSFLVVTRFHAFAGDSSQRLSVLSMSVCVHVAMIICEKFVYTILQTACGNFTTTYVQFGTKMN